jgi:hypothetical protein
MSNFSQNSEFEKIKDDLIKMCEDVLKKCMEGKIYNREEAQIWVNKIPEEIIMNLKLNYTKMKFICNSTILQKKNTSLHFSSTCLWDRKSDGTISVKWEDDKMYCFICLFCVK